MDSVRGKFKLATSKQFYGGTPTRELEFWAVCNDGTEENKRFHKYTPSGNLKMIVDNPTALAYFELGKEYYLDFTKVE